MKHIKLFENFVKNSIEYICDKLWITDYTINEDELIDVNETVNQIMGNKFKKIPLKFNKVHGDFIMYNTLISSLEGSPKYISGDFKIDYNELTSLKDSPEYVGGDFICNNNNIKTLLGLKTEIGGKFSCDPKLDLIYNILKDHIEYIPNFYDFRILDNLNDTKPTLDLRRLNKFIDLYDLEPIKSDAFLSLKNYYTFI